MKEIVINPRKLEKSLEKAYNLTKAIANKNRMTLLCQLSSGEKTVGELESLTGIRQPTLSQQIGVLREEKVISSRREGKNIYYSISNPVALQIIELLYEHYCKQRA